MRLLVLGAGAIGSLLGGRLAQAGHDVLLVGRPEHVSRTRSGGLRLEGRTDAIVSVPVAERIPTGATFDGVVLTVKTFDVAGAARELTERLSGPVPVLALQNGLGVELALARHLEAGGWTDAGRWIVRGVNSVPATFVGPGVVRHAGEGELVLPAGESDSFAGRFARALGEAGFQVRRESDIAREVWRKAIVNAAINPVTADHGIRNGELLHDPWRGQAAALLREALAVARAAGQTFSDEEAERELWKVARATAENRSSMLQDLDRGRPTEIDAISGAIVREGERLGVPTPHTDRVVRRIRARVADRRPPERRDAAQSS